MNEVLDLDKEYFLKALITKIVEDGEIKPSTRMFFRKQQFLGNQYQLFQNVNFRFEKGEPPSIAFLERQYDFKPIRLDMSQYDLSEILKSYLIKGELTEKLIIPHLNSLDKINVNEIKDVFDQINGTLSDFEEIDMVSFGDETVTKGALHKIKDKSSNIVFKDLDAYNHLEMKLGYLVGVLASSGSYKSGVLQTLHTKLDNEVVLHFSLELTKQTFYRRMFVALNWVTDYEIDYLTDNQIDILSKRLAKRYPHWYFSTLDVMKSDANISQIEKMIKYYKQIYKETKKMVVFIDYVQLLNEDFDAKTCRVNKKLHDIAVKYNVLIVEGIQGNDEATKYDSPPELSHIAFVKSLKNDCDIIISQKLSYFESSPHKPQLWTKTKKHRHGKPVDFKYEIDYSHRCEKKGNWTMIQKPQVVTVKDYDYVVGKFDWEEDEPTPSVEIDEDINPLDEI